MKILPARLSSSPDLKQRFEREAKAVSSCSTRTFAATMTISLVPG